jgi:hypothetical protein
MPSDPNVNTTDDARLWLSEPAALLSREQIHRIADYVRTTAGTALGIQQDSDLTRLSGADIFVLALRSHRAQLGLDVIGSFLALAALRGSVFAKAALAQILQAGAENGSQVPNTAGSGFSARRQISRMMRDLQARLRNYEVLDDFDRLQREFEATNNALTIAQALDTMRREGTAGASYKVIAPRLGSVRHFDGGGEDYKALAGPLALWRSPVSVSALRIALELEYPHMVEAAGTVAEFVAGGRAASRRPLLLVGPAGIGKDAIIRRAAELAKRPHAEFDLSGSADSRVLRGTGKGWSTASPSFPILVCVENKCGNPVIQFSELDRAGGTRRNGQVHETLLGWCEPSTRRKWFDEGLATSVDLEDVAFSFTSNSVDDTPGPLLSRLRVLHVERPRPEHVDQLLTQARRRYAAELSLRVEDLPLIENAVVAHLQKVARSGRLHLRLLDQIVRALGTRTRASYRH